MPRSVVSASPVSMGLNVMLKMRSKDPVNGIISDLVSLVLIVPRWIPAILLILVLVCMVLSVTIRILHVSFGILRHAEMVSNVLVRKMGVIFGIQRSVVLDPSVVLRVISVHTFTRKLMH
jgi:hypothetical protein